MKVYLDRSGQQEEQQVLQGEDGQHTTHLFVGHVLHYGHEVYHHQHGWDTCNIIFFSNVKEGTGQGQQKSKIPLFASTLKG